MNPPYGERLGEAEELQPLYALLGERLRAGYLGWQAAVLTGNPALGRELRINARRTHRCSTGRSNAGCCGFDRADAIRARRASRAGRP